MQHPADGIVKELGLGESLVSTFVSDDPKAGSHEAGPESVKCPKRKLGSAIKKRMGQLQNLRREEPVQIGSGLEEDGQGGEIANTINGDNWDKK